MYWDYGVVTGVGVGLGAGSGVGIGFLIGNSEGILIFMLVSLWGLVLFIAGKT